MHLLKTQFADFFFTFQKSQDIDERYIDIVVISARLQRMLYQRCALLTAFEGKIGKSHDPVGAFAVEFSFDGFARKFDGLLIFALSPENPRACRESLGQIRRKSQGALGGIETFLNPAIVLFIPVVKEPTNICESRV